MTHIPETAGRKSAESDPKSGSPRLAGLGSDKAVQHEAPSP